MSYRVDPGRISHERLGHEVLIIDVARGSYFAGTGTAADLWTLVSQGASAEEAARRLADVYRLDEPTVLEDIGPCLTKLVDRGVLQQIASVDAPPVPLPGGDRPAWSAPSFEEFTDMWDLIQLDPIHDFGDAGWPFAAPSPRV